MFDRSFIPQTIALPAGKLQAIWRRDMEEPMANPLETATSAHGLLCVTSPANRENAWRYAEPGPYLTSGSAPAVVIERPALAFAGRPSQHPACSSSTSTAWSSSRKVPFVSWATFWKLAKTSSLPRKVPDSWLRPGVCHTMSSGAARPALPCPRQRTLGSPSGSVPRSDGPQDSPFVGRRSKSKADVAPSPYALIESAGPEEEEPPEHRS